MVPLIADYHPHDNAYYSQPLLWGREPLPYQQSVRNDLLNLLPPMQEAFWMLAAAMTISPIRYPTGYMWSV